MYTYIIKFTFIIYIQIDAFTIISTLAFALLMWLAALNLVSVTWS